MNDLKSFWKFAVLIYSIALLAGLGFLGVVVWGIINLVQWVVTL